MRRKKEITFKYNYTGVTSELLFLHILFALLNIRFSGYSDKVTHGG
jgi:hypothetical protein